MWNINDRRNIKTYSGHSLGVTTVARIDADHFVSGSEDKTLKLWNRNSDTAMRTYLGHTDIILTVATINADHFVSGSNDKTLKLWNKKNTEAIETYSVHTNIIFAVAILDAKHIVSGSNGQLLMLSLPGNIQAVIRSVLPAPAEMQQNVISSSSIGDITINSEDTYMISSPFFTKMRTEFIKYLESLFFEKKSEVKNYINYIMPKQKYTQIIANKNNYYNTLITFLNDNHNLSFYLKTKTNLSKFIKVLDKLYISGKFEKKIDFKLVLICILFMFIISYHSKMGQSNFKKFVKSYYTSFEKYIDTEDDEPEILEHFHTKILDLIEGTDKKIPVDIKKLRDIFNDEQSECIFNKLLMMKSYPIDITETVEHIDIHLGQIEAKPIQIYKYLAKDKGNIVIRIRNQVLDGNKSIYILTKRKQINDIKKDPKRTFYGCKQLNGSAADDNLDKTVKYIDNSTLGIFVGHKMWNVELLKEPEFKHGQYFILQNMRKSYPSYSTVIQNDPTRGETIVSSWHCNVDNPAQTALLLPGHAVGGAFSSNSEDTVSSISS